MKLILCEDVDNLGHMGDTVTVADGYARNFLVPRKMALPIDSAGAKEVEHQLAIIRRREEKLRAQQAEQARKIEGVTVEFKMRAGEGEKIFGSVTSANIAEKLAELGHDIDKRLIQLKEHIKELGIFTVPVRLGKGIEANVKVWVTAIEPETTETTEQAEQAS